MSEFIDLRPAVLTIKQKFAARGMQAEYEAYEKAARHYERMQAKYPKGHPERRAAHAEWIARLDVLYPDDAKEG